MVNLIIRPNALNFVQCMQNGTPMVALKKITFFNKINSIHVSYFCDIIVVIKKKQTLKTSTFHTGFGIKVL
jgi:hypothetical protein